jgi:hypothetical protein
MDLLDTDVGLEVRRDWKPSKIFPCAILSLCTECKQYLPIDSFYSSRSASKGRTDILGVPRANFCRSCGIKRFVASDPRKKLLNSAKQRAKASGLDFDFILDDIVIPEFCPALGIKLVPSVGEGRKSLTELEASPSLDRVDNNKGYVKGNVCVISLRANNLKKDATLEELRALIAHMQKTEHEPVSDVSSDLLAEAKEIAKNKMLGRVQRASAAPEGIATMRCSRCSLNLPLERYSPLRNRSNGQICSDGVSRLKHCKECAVEIFLVTDHRAKLLNAARRRSRKFGHEFDLQKEDIPIPECCPVLGIKLCPSVGKGRKDINLLDASPSIDRIDSSKGYTKDNVQVISFRANNLKKDATAGEIQALVDYVETFHEANTMLDPLFTATTTAWRMVP